MITTCVNCERLRAELTHMQTQAGHDSCADYAVKNAELTAEVERLRNGLTYIIDKLHDLTGCCCVAGTYDCPLHEALALASEAEVGR